MQLLVAFTEQQDFSPGRHVIPAYRLRVISNITIGFVGQICQIFFTGLCLCKASTHMKPPVGQTESIEEDMRVAVPVFLRATSTNVEASLLGFAISSIMLNVLA